MMTPIDDTSWAILEALQENARLSYAELGKKVGLSAPAVAERVRRLEESGAIRGYHAVLDRPAVGLPITVFIQLGMAHLRSKEVIAAVRSMPEVMACYNITGKDCFLIEASVTSMDQLAGLTGQLSQYGQTTTSVVLSTPVKRRTITCQGARDPGSHSEA